MIDPLWQSYVNFTRISLETPPRILSGTFKYTSRNASHDFSQYSFRFFYGILLSIPPWRRLFWIPTGDFPKFQQFLENFTGFLKSYRFYLEFFTGILDLIGLLPEVDREISSTVSPAFSAKREGFFSGFITEFLQEFCYVCKLL